jgi:hypothetical protein
MAWVFKEKLWKKNRSVSIADAEEKPNKSTAAESRTDNSSQLRPGKDVPDEQPVTESAVQQEAKPTPDKKRYRGIRSGKPKAARPEKKDEVVKKAAHEKPPEEVQKEKKTRDSEAGIVKQKTSFDQKNSPGESVFSLRPRQACAGS